MARTRSLLFAGLLLVPLTLATSCGSPTDPNRAAYGTYTLSQINGQSLPFRSISGNVRVAYTNGTLVLTSDQTYSETASVVWTDLATGKDATHTHRDRGTFTINGESVTFQPLDAASGSYSGQLTRGGALTYSYNGNTMLYRK